MAKIRDYSFDERPFRLMSKHDQRIMEGLLNELGYSDGLCLLRLEQVPDMEFRDIVMDQLSADARLKLILTLVHLDLYQPVVDGYVRCN